MNRRYFLKRGATVLPFAGLGLLAARPGAAKECSTVQDRSTETFPLLNVCTDEVMVLTLHRHVTTKTCVEKDGTTTFRLHYQFHGEGYGEDTGHQYVVNHQAFSRTISVQPGTCPVRFDSSIRIVAVGKGRVPNEYILVTTTGTIDCDGDVIPDSYNATFDCRGAGQ